MPNALPELREAFDALFVAPFACHRWASAQGRSHWVDLEGWQDSMAGPLSSISTTGGCGYVYPREDWIFAGVSNPAGLRARRLEWHAGLAAAVEQFVPTVLDEAADLVFMRSVVGQMRELVERACVVEQVRWDAASYAERGAAPDRQDMMGFPGS